MNLPAEPTREQAEAAANLIIRGAQSLYEGLYLFSKIKGWLVLGYDSFGAWATENLDYSEWNSYQELARAKVLGVVAERLGLPFESVVAAAPIIPLHEASKMAKAMDSTDTEMFETTPEGAAKLIEKVKGEVVPSEQAPSNRRVTVLRWAIKIRKMPYPDTVDKDLRMALIEAREFIDDCLKEV